VDRILLTSTAASRSYTTNSLFGSEAENYPAYHEKVWREEELTFAVRRIGYGASMDMQPTNQCTTILFSGLKPPQ
jgi:hypothetical protein